MIKILNIILFSFPILLLAQSNTKIINGQVFDYETKEPVCLVSIKENNTLVNEIGTTDLQGYFNLNVQETANFLVFTHFAYETVKINLKEKHQKTLKIFLHPKQFFLDEVIVKPDSTARNIVEKAALNLKNCLADKPYLADAHFLATRKKDGKYVFFAEAIAEHFNFAYAGSSSTSISKPINYRISDQDFSFVSIMEPTFPPGPRYSGAYEEILLPIILNQVFSFKCIDTIYIEKHKHLLISYKINQKKAKEAAKKNRNYLFYNKTHYQYGTLLINANNYTATNITNRGIYTYNGNNIAYISEYSFKNRNKKQYISKRIYTTTFQSKSLTSENYENIVSKEIVKFNNFKISQLTNKQLETRFNCKLLNKYLFDLLPAPENKKSTYNPQYWANKQNPKDWKKIKSDLKELSGIDLEKQFANNTEYLISKSKYMRLKKYASKETRKNMSRNYKYLIEKSFFND